MKADPIKLKAPETKESHLNKNWLFVRNTGGGYHVEKTTDPIGVQNVDNGESWIAPGSYIEKHPAVVESGFTDEAIKTAVEDWVSEGGPEQLAA